MFDYVYILHDYVYILHILFSHNTENGEKFVHLVCVWGGGGGISH